eukprot:381414-Amphidinium_carterae.1
MGVGGSYPYPCPVRGFIGGTTPGLTGRRESNGLPLVVVPWELPEVWERPGEPPMHSWVVGKRPGVAVEVEVEVE